MRFAARRLWLATKKAATKLNLLKNDLVELAPLVVQNHLKNSQAVARDKSGRALRLKNEDGFAYRWRCVK
ncbi:hypothetical protein [Propionivibrio sp.]|uniref:hypothetical protein n=1 Tax=Propionivibrio sp. TaxID=2212460 RepID=UPI003BF19822